MFLLKICFVTAPSLLFHWAIPRIGQLSGFWVGKSAVSCRKFVEEICFPHVSISSIAQTEKTSWTKTEIKENAWPLDSASWEYGPSRFDCLSRWYKFSPQQDCIARRTAARHQAPSMTPSWTLLGAQGNCFHQISLFGGHIIKVCWPVLAKIETAWTLCRGLRDWGGKHCNLHDFIWWYVLF